MLCSATYRYNDHYFLDAVPKISVKFSGGYFSDTLLVEGVEDESGASYSHCGVHTGGIGDSELIGGVRLELAVDLVLGAWPGRIGNCGHLASPGDPLQSLLPYEPLTVHRAGPPSSRRNWRQTLRTPYRPLLASLTRLIVLRVSASFLDRSEAFPGSRATAACAYQVDGAIGRTRRTGSTPQASRCSLMNAIICGTGGRAPLGQNRPTPSSGSRWRCAVPCSRAPAL